MKMYEIPWMLVQNKIHYYPGGREIDRFRGVTPPKDDNCPECWVGSDIPMRYAYLGDDKNRGCAKVILPDGNEKYLFEAIHNAPVKALGTEHVKKEGSALGVLVKLLDAEKQLGLQAHPSREYAKRHFGSDFGKEESWYVIGVRDDTPEPPYILLGFKEGVTREIFEAAYRKQDLPAMEGCCHKIRVQKGDVFFVSAGAPHAIGGGVFVVEVQEPSDITVGVNAPPDSLNEKEKEEYAQTLLGCYDYHGRNAQDNAKAYKIPPRIIREGSWGKEVLLIGSEQTRYFSFTQLNAKAPAETLDVRAPQVGIVLSGSGRLKTEQGEITVQKADEFFLPYDCHSVSVLPDTGTELSLILAKPQIFD